MRELVAIVHPLNPISSKELVNGQVTGLRDGQARTLLLPNFNRVRTLFEYGLPLPEEQKDKMVEFFDHYFVKNPEGEYQSSLEYNCRTFAGFVALNSALEIPLGKIPKDTYAGSPQSDPYELESGKVYELFRYTNARNNKRVHSTIGLGRPDDGLSIGIHGCYGPIIISGIRSLLSAYHANQIREVSSRKF